MAKNSPRSPAQHPVFGLAQKHAAVQRYRDSHKLPPKIDCGATRELYNKARSTDIWGDKPVDPTIKTAVDKALELPSEATFPAQRLGIVDRLANFEESIKNLNKMLNDPNSKYTIGAYLAVLEEEKAAVTAGIKQQHDAEMAAVKNQINTLPRSDQEKLIAALEKRQAAELAAVEKPINNQLKELHQNAASRTKEIVYLATMRHLQGSGNLLSRQLSGRKSIEDGVQKTLEEKIKVDLLTREQAKPPRPTTIAAGMPQDFDSQAFLDVTFKDIENNLQTITGRPFQLKAVKGKGGADSYICQIAVPWAFYKPYTLEQDFPADMRSLYEAFLAGTDCDTFEVTISHEDPKKAEKMVKIAFLEGVKAGIDPDKITIKASLGKGDKKEETYSSAQLIDMVGQEQFKEAKDAGDKITKQREKFTEQITTASKEQLAEIKEELTKMRTENAATTRSADLLAP